MNLRGKYMGHNTCSTFRRQLHYAIQRVHQRPETSLYEPRKKCRFVKWLVHKYRAFG